MPDSTKEIDKFTDVDTKAFNLIFNRLILFIITLSVCLSCSTASKKTHFYVAGHVYGGPGVINNPFHPPFQNFIDHDTNSFDFAVFTGDIVQESDSNSWNKVDAFIKKLDYPIHFAAGNHDLKDKDLYISRYGETNYSFEESGNLFIFWDLLCSGWNVPQDKIAELKKKMQDKNYNSVFIFSHHIFWYDELITSDIIPNSKYARLEEQTFYPEILKQLINIKIPIYIFAGDVGANSTGSPLILNQIENIKFICSGMGGEVNDNIIEVEIVKKEITLSVIHLNEPNSNKSEPIFNTLSP